MPTTAVNLTLVVACALVDSDGRVLVAQRRQKENDRLSGLWEFPGGKIEAGETPEGALIRELKEELAIDVTRACLAPLTFTSHDYETFHLLMPLYVCRKWHGTLEALVHQDLRWCPPRDLFALAMPPADVPLIAMLRDTL
ncbi:MAG: (deoxy)nucleoside triphosphate pyrophosphohydrolase [Alphaproteobacteria bacterium]|nr:(deoxy)nucleoside triphosphate pyrophosphohydrolase [Alphaproteobacteria bacterium]